MSDNDNKPRPAVIDSEKVLALMNINDLLNTYDKNKNFPVTKEKVRAEILKRMKQGRRN